MYCKKCGCKINAGEKKCSDCGMEVTGIEYSGGFWGLVGEEEKSITDFRAEQSEVTSQEISNTEEVKESKLHIVERRTKEKAPERTYEELVATIKRDSKLKKKYKLLLKLVVCMAIMLLVICLVQSVRVSMVSKKYKGIQAKYGILDQEYQNLNAKYDEISSQYDEVKEQLDKETVPEPDESVEDEATEEDNSPDEDEATEEDNSLDDNNLLDNEENGISDGNL
ncbi:MAG: hypothetical protein ACI4S2_04190 [Lachnospiraceae bacterium]